MFTTLTRILTYGFLGFKRNGWLSTTTASILVIALIVFEGLILFRILTSAALQELQDKADVIIFFKQEAPEDGVLSARKAIESLAEVKQVDYSSADAVLERAKNRFGDDIGQAVNEIGQNPFGPELGIRAYNTKQYETIVGYLDNAPFKDLIREISYKNEKDRIVIERLGRIIDISERGGLAVIVFLTLVSVIVTFNTIRLAIYSSREEIGIMRLVGASNALIRGPYMVEGIIYGVIAAVLSLLVMAPLVYFSAPYVNAFIRSMDLWGYFKSNLLSLFLYQLLFGVGLGVISSFIAVRKYLRI